MTAARAAAHSGVRSPRMWPALSRVVSRMQVPVAEPAPGRVLLRVGLLRPPRLVGGLGQELQVVQVRPGPRCLDEDAVGLGLELVVVDAAGPPRDLPRPRDGDVPGGGRGVERWVPAEQAHVADGGFGFVGAEAGPGGEPLSGGGVPVGVVVVAGVEPPHQPVGRRPQQGGDRPELLQGLGPGGAVEAGRGRGVQVRPEVAADAERVRHAGEAPDRGGQGASRSVWRAHQQPPPPSGAESMRMKLTRRRGRPWRAARLRPRQRAG